MGLSAVTSGKGAFKIKAKVRIDLLIKKILDGRKMEDFKLLPTDLKGKIMKLAVQRW